VQIVCEPPGWLLEIERLEVSTGACNYVLLEHPAQTDVPAESDLRIELWHFDLTAPERYRSARRDLLRHGAAVGDEPRHPAARQGAVHRVLVDATDLAAALTSLSAEALREVVHEVLRQLDERGRARVVGSIIARAARAGAGFAPSPVSDEQVAEVLAFVKAAERLGQADPSEVDEYLQRGSAAFLGKDYATAHRIWGALLPPIADGNIDLGQHELVDEVLGSDVGKCAAQYVVSAYMLAPAAERAEAVRTAIDQVRGVGHLWQPLWELERVAVEPLPELAAFLPRWRSLIASKPAGASRSGWAARRLCMSCAICSRRPSTASHALLRELDVPNAVALHAGSPLPACAARWCLLDVERMLALNDLMRYKAPPC